MKPTKMLTLTLLLLTLAGCGITLGPVAERQTVWAKMGTPGKVVSNTQAEVLVAVDGKNVRSKANIQGMIVLDEPTYNVLLEHWEKRDAR